MLSLLGSMMVFVSQRSGVPPAALQRALDDLSRQVPSAYYATSALNDD